MWRATASLQMPEQALTAEEPKGEAALRVTEQPNVLSKDIDIAPTPKAIEILQACDQQLFQDEGFAGLPVSVTGERIE